MYKQEHTKVTPNGMSRNTDELKPQPNNYKHTNLGLRRFKCMQLKILWRAGKTCVVGVGEQTIRGRYFRLASPPGVFGYPMYELNEKGE